MEVGEREKRRRWARGRGKGSREKRRKWGRGRRVGKIRKRGEQKTEKGRHLQMVR